MEIWKDILEYEENYQISNYGNVRSKNRVVKYSSGGHHQYIGKSRKPSIGEYRMIALSKNGKLKLAKISRLVAIHFIEKENGRNVVNHKDYNKHNDHVDNLEWVSNSENIIHSQKRNDRESVGIFFDEKRKRWCAYVYRNNKNIFVGRFKTKEDAILNQKTKMNDFLQSKY